ncbi:MAG: class I tRNA ligase family protein, partial [Cyanobacteria bacterium J06636_28]
GFAEIHGSKARIVNIDQSGLSKADKDLRRAVHTAIKEISEDVEAGYQFNTAVSELMKLSNALKDAKQQDTDVYAEGVQSLVLLLAPFAPHIAEELWQQLGFSESVHRQSWPTFEQTALVADEITLVIQIKGKTRGTISVPASASKDELEQYARESDIAKKYLEGKEIKKVIVVPGKLVNFVAV